MTIQTGTELPAATLYESTQLQGACALPPSPIDVTESTRGKKVVIVGVIGAFTNTCSLRHLPAYVEQADAFKAKGVDEIWCVAVNDGFAMAAWGQSLNALGKVRFLGDGSAEFTRALGLEVEIPGMGVRLQRCSLLVEDGVVKRLNVEQPMRLDVSDAGTMLQQLG